MWHRSDEHATDAADDVLKRSMDADVDLARRLARDLDGTFEALVVAHQDRLFTIARRLLGDVHDAEEVAQDAFVRAYRALEGYPAERVRELRLRPWLAAIVVNLARNRRRRIADRQPAQPLAPLLAGGLDVTEGAGRGPEARQAVGETRVEWAARLAALPPAYRAAVVLRHVDGLSYDEVAVALGRPEGTVKAQVHRGLRLLRAALEAEATPPATTMHRTEMTA
jgi:RNA polymerase sigma-70 factor (ECF subfamily)